MDEELFHMDEELCLARVIEICSYFSRHKNWKELFALNRRRHPKGGTFVPYRVGANGISYRLADVLAFISRNVPEMTPELANYLLWFHELPEDFELVNLLEAIDDGGAIPRFDVKDGGGDDDTGAFDGCFLREGDFQQALEVVFVVEDGIKRLMGNLIALAKACDGMAATETKPQEQIAGYLSSFGSIAINDADKLLLKLADLGSLLCRNSDQYQEEAIEVAASAAKEVA